MEICTIIELVVYIYSFNIGKQASHGGVKMSAIIKTFDLSRQFKSGRDTINALSDVSISVDQGSLTILKGRSGSGKTTLINLLGALDMPTKGKVYFDGQEITSMSEAQRDLLRRKQMGFIFQSIALMPLMSAFENVDFALRVAGYKAKDRKERVEECLSIVGLAKRMDHRPQELSGGEQQRVAIARAIAHRPKVVFADEPTAELDTNMGLQVMAIFKRLTEQEGLTIVMTTHDPNIMDMADCLYSLEDGRIVG